MGAQSEADHIATLDALDGLHSRGLLTDAEWAAKRNEVIGRLLAMPPSGPGATAPTPVAASRRSGQQGPPRATSRPASRPALRPLALLVAVGAVVLAVVWFSSPFSHGGPATATNLPATQVAAAAAPTSTSSVPFAIASPADGSAVAASSVTVSGTAPAGSTVTDEVLFAEVGAKADSDGRWSMQVTLQEGSNDLTFQLNNDATAQIHLHLTYEPAPTQSSGAGPSPSRGSTAVTPDAATAAIVANEGLVPAVYSNWESLGVAVPSVHEVDVTVSPTLPYGEDLLVRQAAGDALAVSQAVFDTFKSVNVVHLSLLKAYQDTTGHTTVQVNTLVVIFRETAGKFDYAGMSQMDPVQYICAASGWSVRRQDWATLSPADRGCMKAPSGP